MLSKHSTDPGMVLTVPPSMLFGSPPSRAIDAYGLHSCPIQYATPVSVPQHRYSWDGSEQQQFPHSSSSTINPPQAMNGMQRRERRMSFALGDSVPLVTIPECVQEGSSQDRACQQQSSSSAQTSSVFGTYGHTNRAQGPGDSSCSVADVSCSSKRAAHSFCAGQHMMSQHPDSAPRPHHNAHQAGSGAAAAAAAAGFSAPLPIPCRLSRSFSCSPQHSMGLLLQDHHSSSSTMQTAAAVRRPVTPPDQGSAVAAAAAAAGAGGRAYRTSERMCAPNLGMHSSSSGGGSRCQQPQQRQTGCGAYSLPLPGYFSSSPAAVADSATATAAAGDDSEGEHDDNVLSQAELVLLLQHMSREALSPRRLQQRQQQQQQQQQLLLQQQAGEQHLQQQHQQLLLQGGRGAAPPGMEQLLMPLTRTDSSSSSSTCARHQSPMLHSSSSSMRQQQQQQLPVSAHLMGTARSSHTRLHHHHHHHHRQEDPLHHAAAAAAASPPSAAAAAAAAAVLRRQQQLAAAVGELSQQHNEALSALQVISSELQQLILMEDRLGAARAIAAPCSHAAVACEAALQQHQAVLGQALAARDEIEAAVLSTAVELGKCEWMANQAGGVAAAAAAATAQLRG